MRGSHRDTGVDVGQIIGMARQMWQEVGEQRTNSAMLPTLANGTEKGSNAALGAGLDTLQEGFGHLLACL